MIKKIYSFIKKINFVEAAKLFKRIKAFFKMVKKAWKESQ